MELHERHAFMHPDTSLGGSDLLNALDDATEGALYALHYDAMKHGWVPHVWAHKRTDGRTIFLFYATDPEGLTKYFDYTTAYDTGNLVDEVLFFEGMQEMKTTKARLLEGLARLDAGLDPVEHRVDTQKMN